MAGVKAFLATPKHEGLWITSPSPATTSFAELKLNNGSDIVFKLILALLISKIFKFLWPRNSCLVSRDLHKTRISDADIGIPIRLT
jgi:hypothetical protein